MTPNPFRWVEIYVDDMPRAVAFYEAVLATVLTKLDAPSPDLELWGFPMEMGTPGAAGALVKMEGCAAGGSGIIPYFASEDCGVEASRAVAAGGKIHKEKFSIGQYGYISLVVDTEDNMIGFHSGV